MGENPYTSRPRRQRPSWSQVLSIAVAIGVLFGVGGALANHDLVTGIVVGATTLIVALIMYALVLRRRQG